MNKKELLEQELEYYQSCYAKAEIKWIDSIGELAAADARIGTMRTLAESDKGWSKEVKKRDLNGEFNIELTNLRQSINDRKESLADIKETINIVEEMLTENNSKQNHENKKRNPKR